MGVAVYGRGFALANSAQNGLGASASGPIPEAEFTRQNGSWGYNEVLFIEILKHTSHSNGLIC